MTNSELDFTLFAAQGYTVQAEKLSGSAAAKLYLKAAKKYREAVAIDPSRESEFVALAEQYEALAASPKSAAANSSSGSTKNDKKNNDNNHSADEEKTEQNPAPTVQEAQDITVEEAMAKLNSLIGLTKVKDQVQTYTATMESFCDRRKNGLSVPQFFSYHLVFKGNPGTGKTTVARLMGQIFKSLGMLEKGHLVETSRNDLVAEYVGQTAPKTRKVLESALDGVLFIDEAYRLSRSESGNDFGREAIEEILTFMDSHRDRLIVIIAGYNEPIDKFIAINEGLTSRFKNTIEFEDYTPDELISISKGMCKESDYELEPAAESVLLSHFQKLYNNRDKHFGNGRTARNICQSIIETQALRLRKIKAKSPNMITRELQTILTVEDVLTAIGERADVKYIEYMRAKKDYDDPVIYGYLSQNNLGAASIALCSRLESLLKYVYGCSGDLCEMINQLRSSGAKRAKILIKEDYDCIYRIRTFRNAHVHSGFSDVQITKNDITECLKIISTLE